MESTKRSIETEKTADATAPSLPVDPHPEKDPGLALEIEREAEQLRGAFEAERDARLRLAAEYHNYRRRTQEEKERAADVGKRELLTELLSIVDDLDLARDRSSGSPETVAEGVRMIHRRFLDLLDANGVTSFDSDGARFDPERHEAFDVTEAGEGESGTVAKEMRRGYFWKGSLMRPALVVVRK